MSLFDELGWLAIGGYYAAEAGLSERFQKKKINEVSAIVNELTDEALEHIVKRHGTGIEGVRVSPHTCRHFYAQQHIKMGTDLYTISRLLGHENIQITQTYLNSLRDEEVINISKQKSVLLSL